MIKAMIFDVDGTLVDSVDLHARAWCEAFREFGHEIEFARMRHQIGKGADQLMPVFLPEKELKQIGKDLEQRRQEIFREGYLPRVRGFAGVRELFLLFLGFAVLMGCSSTSGMARREMETLPGSKPALTPREKLYVKQAADGKRTRPPVAARDYVKPKPHLPLTNLMMQIADVGGEEPLTPTEFRSPAGARFVRVEF